MNELQALKETITIANNISDDLQGVFDAVTIKICDGDDTQSHLIGIDHHNFQIYCWVGYDDNYELSSIEFQLNEHAIGYNHKDFLMGLLFNGETNKSGLAFISQ